MGRAPGGDAIRAPIPIPIQVPNHTDSRGESAHMRGKGRYCWRAGMGGVWEGEAGTRGKGGETGGGGDITGGTWFGVASGGGEGIHNVGARLYES